jgi:hypothetical protein
MEEAMKKVYYELVIKAPPNLVRGFIDGYFAGSGRQGAVLYGEDEHIECESLAEQVKEWFGMTNVTHLIMEKETLETIRAALKESNKELYDKIKYEREILSAGFEFCFKVYAPSYGDKIKAMLSNVPGGARIRRGYEFKENFSPGAKGPEGYAPQHEYEASGEGVIEGDLDAVLEAHKSVRSLEFIEAQDIRLRFVGDPEVPQD